MDKLSIAIQKQLKAYEKMVRMMMEEAYERGRADGLEGCPCEECRWCEEEMKKRGGR